MLETPQTALPRYDLVYVEDRDFPIRRIRRGKGFSYRLGGRPLKDKEQLQRIRKLAIPPAWEHVRITDLANGHLQAVGRDNRDRKQYRYHPQWSKIRKQTRFYNMAAFGQILPLIRARVVDDLAQKGWPSSKVMALVISLMEETHIRIGNEQYARENKTFGLSTLRKRHVEMGRSSMKFEFTGKKGKRHIVGIRNKKLMRLVQRSMDIPGWELFQYYGPEGEKRSLDSSEVNAYLHQIGNDHFTAKDFRSVLGRFPDLLRHPDGKGMFPRGEGGPGDPRPGLWGCGKGLGEYRECLQEPLRTPLFGLGIPGRFDPELFRTG